MGGRVGPQRDHIGGNHPSVFPIINEGDLADGALRRNYNVSALNAIIGDRRLFSRHRFQPGSIDSTIVEVANLDNWPFHSASNLARSGNPMEDLGAEVRQTQMWRRLGMGNHTPIITEA